MKFERVIYKKKRKQIERTLKTTVYFKIKLS